MLNVVKRDGTKEKYNGFKIVNAIEKAYKACNMECDQSIVQSMLIVLDAQKEDLPVEVIQDMIEQSLMHQGAEKVAKAYILYRSERSRMRKLVKTYNEIVDIEDTDTKTENANVNGDTPAGQMMKFASTASTDYAEAHLINPVYVKAKQDSYIYYHDADYYASKTTTCLQHDLTKLFKDGFHTEHGWLREPSRLESAVDLAAISLQSNQNQQHGGQAIVCWDNHMVPYAKKSFKNYFLETYVDVLFDQEDITDRDAENIDHVKGMMEDLRKILEKKYGAIELGNKALEKEQKTIFKIAKRKLIKESDQAHESFVSNMNTMHSRGGGQVVFSSVNTGTDFSPEGRIINKSLLKALYKGLGKGETSIFPIVIWKVKELVNWSDADFAKAVKHPLKALNGDIQFETPNFDLTVYAMHVAAKRLFPTFMFLDSTFNRHEKWDINDANRFLYEGATIDKPVA